MRLGEPNAQSRWVLERAGASEPEFLPHAEPEFLPHVFLRARDVMRESFPVARESFPLARHDEPVRDMASGPARLLGRTQAPTVTGCLTTAQNK